MSNMHQVTLTDTFNVEANFAWAKQATVTMPELTHYGYDGGTNYYQANKKYNRELLRRAKAAVGLTGVRGKVFIHGETIEFRPYRCNMVMFVG